MTTYLLVPGANPLGWWYDPLVERLQASGHTAVAVTLTGLDPAAEPPRETVTLDDHVAQAIAELRAVPVDADAPEGRDAVLVGHSYGGSIISGVADAQPHRARADEQFTVHAWDTSHNVMREGPSRVLELIADL